MVFAICVILFAAAMLIGNTLGWFHSGQRIYVADVQGNVTITRNDIGYSLKSGVYLKEGDLLETGSGDSVELQIGDGQKIAINENSSLLITKDSDRDQTEITLNEGELYCEVSGFEESSGYLLISCSNGTVLMNSSTVLSITGLAGSTTANIFSGEATLTADSSDWTMQQEKCGMILTNSDGEHSVTSDLLNASSLNDFILNHAIATSGSESLCFDAQTLQGVVDARAAEAAAAQAAADASLSNLLTQSSTGTSGSSSSSGSSDQSDTTSGSSSSDSGDTKAIYTCTIQIRCDTILDNMENLTKGKESYVPSNGVILGTSVVQFYEGETVYDVLKRVCNAAGIQLEYSYSSLYESAYIEGINNLYEFDCGSESGWMYKVNGWFPNYGCSRYVLQAGDTITWCYTCNGLGADVGGPSW